MKKSFYQRSLYLLCGCILSLVAIQGTLAQPTEPTFTISDPVLLLDLSFNKEANLAINTNEQEVLFTTIDTLGLDFDPTDPITGEDSQESLIGFFYDPVTLEQKSEPFIIVGNPRGTLEKHSVTYNPVSNQYFIAVAANSYSPSNNRVPLLAIVNSQSAAGNNSPVVKAWTLDANTTQNYQDTAVAASSKNGNMIYVSEYSPAGEEEGVVGHLFDQEGNQLTTEFTRLDTIVPTRDEDDPDVFYLEENDAFLFLTNVDVAQGEPNRITATVVQTTPGADGKLQLGNQQIVSQLRKNVTAGHPAAIENPFNNELIGVFDYDNGAQGGDIFYFEIGPAPDYVLTESREQIPYLEATANDPYSQRHPQLAVDPNRGVIVLVTNAAGNFQGMAFTLLGPDGGILPGRPDDQYKLIETQTPISNDANYYNVKYDPHSESFLIVYATGAGLTNVIRLEVTSNHLDSTSIFDWMIME